MLLQRLSRFARDHRVRAHGSSGQANGFACTANRFAEFFFRRCSAPSSSASTTTLPLCVIRCARLHQMLNLASWVHPAGSALERLSISTMLSPSCSGNLHTARGAWCKCRPRHSKRLRSARVECVRTRFLVWLTRDLPVLLARCGMFLCPSSCSSSWSSAGAPEAGLCHCLFCVAWVCIQRQSSVAVPHTVVQQTNFVVISKSRSGPVHQLKIIVQLPS